MFIRKHIIQTQNIYVLYVNIYVAFQNQFKNVNLACDLFQNY
jgi:hypothetical protein